MTAYRIWPVSSYSWACEWPGCKTECSGMGSEEAAAIVAETHIAEHRHLDPEGTYDPALFPDDWKREW